MYLDRQKQYIETLAVVYSIIIVSLTIIKVQLIEIYMGLFIIGYFLVTILFNPRKRTRDIMAFILIAIVVYMLGLKILSIING